MKSIIFWIVLLLIVLTVIFGGQVLIYIGNFLSWLGGMLKVVGFGGG